jgi:antitoxin CptB
MTDDPRLKRIRLRSWRRGIREMDLLLGGFAEAHLAGLSPEDLDLYEALLEESDRDLYAWVTCREPVPPRHAALVARVAGHAREAPREQGFVL